jgi:hypothetical protein
MITSGLDEKAIPARTSRKRSSVSTALGPILANRRTASADDSPPSARGVCVAEGIAAAGVEDDPASDCASDGACGVWIMQAEDDHARLLDIDVRKPGVTPGPMGIDFGNTAAPGVPPQRPGPVSAPPTGPITPEGVCWPRVPPASMSGPTAWGGRGSSGASLPSVSFAVR